MTSSSVGELYDAYVRSYRKGEVDPSPFMAGLDARQRDELEIMIENFLDTEPAREWDEEDFKGSFSAKMSAEVAASLAGQSGQLPELLPRLRYQKKVLVEDLESRLAGELGAESDDETAKVGDYYHQLEYGTLPAAPVSERVFEALAKIFGVDAGRLKAAGRALGPDKEHRGGPVYARVVGAVPVAGTASPAGESESIEELDGGPGEVDRRTKIDDMFLGPAE